MIIVDAVLIGYKLVDLLSVIERKGKVHSVFDKVVNVEGLSDNIVTISVNSPQVPMHAYMIRLDVAATSLFKHVGLNIGDEVLVNGNSMHIGNKLLVRLRRTKIWAPELGVESIAKVCLIKEIVYNLINVARTYVSDKSFTQLFNVIDIEEIFSTREEKLLNTTNKAVNAILGLIESIKHCSYKNICEHVCNLIGLGEGLTPSGDDFLSGMLVTFQWINRTIGLNPILRKVVERMIKCITKCWHKTTPISKQMFSRAIVGELNSYVHELLKGVIQGDPVKALSGLERTSRIGGTSGKDIILGVLLAFVLFLKYGLESNNTPSV